MLNNDFSRNKFLLEQSNNVKILFMFLYKNRKTLKTDKNSKNPAYKSSWSIKNIIVYVFILTIPIDTYAFLRLVIPLFSSPISIDVGDISNMGTSYYPTSIPWINNPSRCENSGRSWENNKCWDSEHSPTF